MNTNSNFDPKIVEKLFQCTLPENYTKDDIDYAQICYISSQSFEFYSLIQNYHLCPTLIIETLAVLYDNIDITPLGFFPFNILSSYIDNGDFEKIEMIQKLCELKEPIFINLLYCIAFKTTESTAKYFSNLSVILGFKGCWKYFENIELWGLKREKTGFITKNDEKILLKVKYKNFDITKVNEYMKEHSELIYLFDNFDVKLANNSNYYLSFFLESAFSLISGFSPEEKIDQKVNIEISNIINQIYECIFPLLSNPTVKNNFCELIKNAYSQDRTKMKYNKNENCGDSFCYVMCMLLLKIARGIFNASFIDKIDEKKFPTFCFFYIARLMEISLSKLIDDIKEEYNRNNSVILIYNEADLIQEYLNFVYSLIFNRKNEIFNMFLGEQTGLNSIEEVEKFNGIFQISTEDKKAEKVRDILCDHSFISTILSVQAILPFKKVNKDITYFINHLMSYKNSFKKDCLYILTKSGFELPKTTISRIVLHYSDKSDEDIYNDRFIIHDLLKNYEVEISSDSLRMISFALGSLEEKLSLIFDNIIKIKSHKEKSVILNKIYEESNENEHLSEDEEVFETYSDDFLLAMSRLTDAQLLETIKKKVDATRVNDLFKDIKTQIKIKNNPFKLKVYKKIKVNNARIERYERSLKSHNYYLDSLLKFLQSFTKINRKLFLNKNVFFRLFSIINPVLNLLVGEQSHKVKLQNKEDYMFYPKEILRMVNLIIINILKGNNTLIQSSGLHKDLVEKAYEVIKTKFLMMEDQILDLYEIINALPDKSGDNVADEDIPDEFLDPLTFTIMLNPVIMLTSKITIDRSTFNQIMLNDRIDPFSRLPLDNTKIVDDIELKKKIEEYLRNNNVKN